MNHMKGFSSGLLVSGAYDFIIRTWSSSTWAQASTFTGHTAGINAIVVFPSGLFMASASDDTTVIIWNVTSGTAMFTLSNHTAAVFCLTLLSNGYLASGSLDYSIIIWNNNTGALVIKLNGHTGSVNSLAVLSNGYLVSASNDRTIKLWNANTGAIIATLYNHTNAVNALAVLTNG